MSIKVWAFSESPRLQNEMAAVSRPLRSQPGGYTVVRLDGAGPDLAGDAKIVLKGTEPLAGSPELRPRRCPGLRRRPTPISYWSAQQGTERR